MTFYFTEFPFIDFDKPYCDQLEVNVHFTVVEQKLAHFNYTTNKAHFAANFDYSSDFVVDIRLKVIVMILQDLLILLDHIVNQTIFAGCLFIKIMVNELRPSHVVD